MKKILVLASILLLTFGTINGLSFDGGYQMKRVEQQYTPPSFQISSINIMPTELENEDDSDRILKVSEPTSMLLLGFGLLALGRFGQKRFKS